MRASHHARHVAAARANCLSGDPRAAGSTRCRSMSAIAATSPACIATSTPARSRTEEMTGDVADLVLAFLERRRISTLDITGGAPELNPHFRRLVTRRARLGVARHGPLQPDDFGGSRARRTLPRFLAGQQVEIVASMPCYLRGQCRPPARQGRVRRARSAACRRSTRSATADDGSGLVLNLVYNPQGPSLPPRAGGARSRLQARARRAATASCSTALYTLANMPIQRFGSMLISKGEFDDYLALLQRRASRRQSRRRHVPQPDLGRLARLRLRLRLQPDARPAARAGGARARAPVATCSTRDLDGQPDPRRRPLLRLHRRPGLELRRRAERGGGITLGRMCHDSPSSCRCSTKAPASPPRLTRLRRYRARAAPRSSSSTAAAVTTPSTLARPLADRVLAAPRGRARADECRRRGGDAATSCCSCMPIRGCRTMPIALVLEGLARAGAAWGRFDVTHRRAPPACSRVVAAHDELRARA